MTCWIAAALTERLRGVTEAYYLVHSMGSSGSFEENDRKAAGNFGAAAKAEGVERIIYLGGLGNERKSCRHTCEVVRRWVTFFATLVCR